MMTTKRHRLPRAKPSLAMIWQVRAMLRRSARCQVYFNVTEPMADMLEELAASGLHGAGTKHEAALRLVEDGLRRLHADGTFRRLKR